MPIEQPPRHDVLRNRLEISGDLIALTALRVGAGRATDVLSNDLPVLRDGAGRPFIPGASLKGAFRARIEAVLRAVAPAPATLDFNDLDGLAAAIERAGGPARISLPALSQTLRPAAAVLDFGQLEQRTRAVRAFKEAVPTLPDGDFTDIVYQQATLIDLTFGSPEVAGRLFFRDAPVAADLWFDQFEVRNGVVLNRDTETAEDSLLYDYETVPAGLPFEFQLTLENAADWQCGLVLFALGPWLRGEAQIGGFRSRGLGYVQLNPATLKRRYVAVSDVDSVLRLLDLGLDDQADVVTEAQETAWKAAFARELRALAADAPGGRDA